MIFCKCTATPLPTRGRASIELDYVVLLAQSNPEAARKAFAKVKSRITSGSPLYTRVKDLEKTYD